ncbi:unnamed protein product [Cylindrotheca closterium]|uniref:Uncharacterized protein n=1 Tax=Cylindrotheca closterium TaxID=2856 RepID=A0AAD2CSR8_9STRA|nr:unnamed protein product [Cylindrotheca closterium]
MSTAQGNIFLTAENLAFSLPLLLVCGTYAFFKFVPLQYGIPVLGGLALLIKMQSQVQAQRDEKLTKMDDKAIDDLANELEGEEKSDKDNKKKLTAKKRAQVEQRLAAERKQYAKQNKKGSADDDDGDDYLETFAKGGTKKKK